MTRLTCACVAAIGIYTLAPNLVGQSVYPTGTTIYAPDRTWNGYTVLSPLQTQAVLVIDMNGHVVKRWEDYNTSAGGPAVCCRAASSSPRAARVAELICSQSKLPRALLKAPAALMGCSAYQTSQSGT